MAFGDRSGTNWGCLAATLFLVMVALPALAGLMLSDCASLDAGECGSKRWSILITALALAAATIAVMWAVNWVVRRFRGR